MSRPSKAKQCRVTQKQKQKENDEHREAMETYKTNLIASMPGKFIQSVKGDGCCLGQACFAWLFFHNKVQTFNAFIQKIIRELIKSYDAYAPLCGRKSGDGEDYESLDQLLWQLKYYFVFGRHKVPFCDALPLIIATAMSTKIIVHNISINGQVSVQFVNPLRGLPPKAAIELVGSTQPDHVDVILDKSLERFCSDQPLEYLTSLSVIECYFQAEGFDDNGKPKQARIKSNAVSQSMPCEEIINEVSKDTIVLDNQTSTSNEAVTKASNTIIINNKFRNGPKTPPGTPPNSRSRTPIGSPWSTTSQEDQSVSESEQESDTDIYVPDQELKKKKAARKRKLRVAFTTRKKNVKQAVGKKRKLDLPSANEAISTTAESLPEAVLPKYSISTDIPVKLKGSRVTMLGGIRPVSELSFVNSRQGQKSVNFEGYRFLNHRHPSSGSLTVIYRCGSFKATKCHSRIHVREGERTFFITNSHNHGPVMKLPPKEISTQTEFVEATAVGASEKQKLSVREISVQTEYMQPVAAGKTSSNECKEVQTEKAESAEITVQTEEIKTSNQELGVQTYSEDLIQINMLSEETFPTGTGEALTGAANFTVSGMRDDNRLPFSPWNEFSRDSTSSSNEDVANYTENECSSDPYETNNVPYVLNHSCSSQEGCSNRLVDVKIEIPEMDIYDGIFFGTQSLPNMVELNGHNWTRVKGFKGACSVCHKKSKRDPKFRCSKCNQVFDETCWTVYHSPRYSVAGLGSTE